MQLISKTLRKALTVTALLAATMIAVPSEGTAQRRNDKSRSRNAQQYRQARAQAAAPARGHPSRSSPAPQIEHAFSGPASRTAAGGCSARRRSTRCGTTRRKPPQLGSAPHTARSRLPRRSAAGSRPTRRRTACRRPTRRRTACRHPTRRRTACRHPTRRRPARRRPTRRRTACRRAASRSDACRGSEAFGAGCSLGVAARSFGAGGSPRRSTTRGKPASASGK